MKDESDNVEISQRLSRLGEVHLVDPAVVRLTASGDKARRLHLVEVVGQGGAFDTDGVGEIADR
jgi:hypothetical protein